jgi:uncharacterized protein YdaU (DUF1376 family)
MGQLSGRFWMRWNVDGFIAQTAHHDAANTGALVCLRSHYWKNGALPKDDRSLARIARMTPAQWRANRAVLAEHFGPDWSSPELDEQIADAEHRIDKRRQAGAKGGARSAESRANKQANAATEVDHVAEQCSTHHTWARKNRAAIVAARELTTMRCSGG